MNNEQPIIVGLDIGTTKIAVIAGRKNEFGKLEIIGFGRANSNGVKHGQVLNIDETFKAMNDVDFPVQKVLDGMDAAAQVGLGPIKVNMVVKRGLNETSILPMARFFREKGYILRFIEYMDVGHTNGWRLDDVVPAAEIVRTISAEMPLEPVDPNYTGEVAERWRYKDGKGEIGVLSHGEVPTHVRIAPVAVLD